MTDPVEKTNNVVVDAAAPVVEFKGKKFTLPVDFNEADGDVLEYLDKEKLTLALEALLGPEQYADYKSLKPKVKDHGEVLEKCFKAMESDTGK